MIKFIAAIDGKRGIADDKGIPWFGKIPTDINRFRAETLNHSIVMGYRTYEELKTPLSERRNLVVTRAGTSLRPGFEVVEDPEALLRNATEDIWVIGGAAMFAELLPFADVLDLTRVEGDFECTKFFPEFESTFQRVSRGEDITESSITYHFEIWKPRSKGS